MPAAIESRVVSCVKEAVGWHYIESEARTLHTTLGAGEHIAPRYNRRGTEFVGILNGSAVINGSTLSSGEVLRIDTGEIVEIATATGCELVSHIIPYRPALVHVPYTAGPANEGPLVSLIIIAKNLQNYICQALASCLNQTHGNVEVIVVNDCSKDATASRIESMARFDPRIQLHNVDLGANGARRYGLERASGEYLLIIDGDDWINSDAVENLLSTATNLDSDLVQFGYDLYNDLNRHVTGETFPSKTPASQLLMPKPIADEDAKLQAAVNHTIWMNFFSKKVCVAALNAMPDLSLYEDLPFSLSLIQHAKNPAFCNRVMYHYRRERAGQTTQNWDTVTAARKQASLTAAVEHTLKQFDRDVEFYQLVLLYKIDLIVEHELGLSSGLDAESWRRLLPELFAKFPPALHDRLIGREIKQRLAGFKRGRWPFRTARGSSA